MLQTCLTNLSVYMWETAEPLRAVPARSPTCLPLYMAWSLNPGRCAATSCTKATADCLAAAISSAAWPLKCCCSVQPTCEHNTHSCNPVVGHCMCSIST
jgi:hypothetical protein